MGLDAILIPAVLFFALGVFARIIRSDLKFPEDLSKALSLYLLVAIGLKGGMELASVEFGLAIKSIIWAFILGSVTPIIGYMLLRFRNQIDRMNAAAIAAHYGSVSAGTFLTAIAFLDVSGVEYETYPIIMMVIMETPAIIIGLLLAALARKQLQQQQDGEPMSTPWKSLLHEALTHGSVVLLLGAMVIGAISSPDAIAKVYPFTHEIFMGVLCLFLLDLGMEAARRMRAFKEVGVTLIAFGIIMPLIGGTIGMLVAVHFLGFSVGGTLLVAILGASASYIAVPPAMRMGVPEANPSYYLTLSLGITFPFNVLVGIPLFYNLSIWYIG